MKNFILILLITVSLRAEYKSIFGNTEEERLQKQDELLNHMFNTQKGVFENAGKLINYKIKKYKDEKEAEEKAIIEEAERKEAKKKLFEQMNGGEKNDSQRGENMIIITDNKKK